MRFLLTIALAVLAAGQGNAAPQFFYGEDQGTGSNDVRLANYPNATSARAAFVDAVGAIGIEDFETLTSQASAPLPLDFDGNPALLTGAGIVRDWPEGTYAGTYPLSGINYFLVDNPTAPFTVTFTSPVSAFGFYATDICDFLGTITVHLDTGPTYLLGSNSQRLTGGVLFWGVVDDLAPFTTITLTPDTYDHGWGPSADGFGLDDMIVGADSAIPAANTSWGAVKSLFR
jgi:hypothetical protein